MRTISSLSLALVISAAGADAAFACGDKFIRIGRQLRYGRYVAVYPANILVYGPPKSAPFRISDLTAVLKRAGHTATVVTRPEQLSSALKSGGFDLVLAGLGHANEVVREAALSPTRPDLVPVLITPTREEETAARKLSPCLISVPSEHKTDALAHIDHRMELRLKGALPPDADRRR